MIHLQFSIRKVLVNSTIGSNTSSLDSVSTTFHGCAAKAFVGCIPGCQFAVRSPGDDSYSVDKEAALIVEVPDNLRTFVCLRLAWEDYNNEFIQTGSFGKMNVETCNNLYGQLVATPAKTRTQPGI